MRLELDLCPRLGYVFVRLGNFEMFWGNREGFRWGSDAT